MPGAEHPLFSADELNQLFAPAAGEPAIALAVSGGSDSLALMHLAARWAGTRKLAVLTVDHGLRAASAREAQQVGNWAEALELPHAVLKWEDEKPSTGIQARAREARYRLMADWCERESIRVLMTAHTIDDQAETVLMRMARGTSIEGMAAMAIDTRLRSSLRLVRPLLAIPRERLRAFLRDLGQSWIDDPSNEDERFERTRMRNALPGLARAGITTAALADVAALARQAHLALDQAMLGVIERHSRHHAEGYAEFHRPAFDGLTEEMQLRILAWHIRRYGGGMRPERAELARLATALSSEAATRHTLGGAIIAPRKREIVFGREPARIDATPMALRDGMVWDNRFQIRAARSENLFVQQLGSLSSPHPEVRAKRASKDPACGTAEPRGSNWPSGAPTLVLRGSLRSHLRMRMMKEHDIPRFVWASVPAIVKERAIVAIPLLGIGDPAFITEFNPVNS